MQPSQTIQVKGKQGLVGVIHPAQQAEDRNPAHWLVEFPDQQRVWVPVDLFEAQEDGSYYLPLSPDQLKISSTRGDAQGHPQLESSGVGGQERVVIPVIVEELEVQKREATTGRVRVAKRVYEHEERVEETGFTEQVEVERVPVNREVSEPVSIRYEGEIMVIPVLEEVLVVEKRLILREEVRIRKLRHQGEPSQAVTLRKEEVTVERLAEDDGG